MSIVISFILFRKGVHNMFKSQTRLCSRIFSTLSSLYANLAAKFYIFRKNSYKVIDEYNNYLKEELTNEGVYHYILNINNLPKVSYTQIQSEQIREIAVMVNKSTNISEDLKAQLRLVLRSKGLKNI
jgi:hypothetical protein